VLALVAWPSERGVEMIPHPAPLLPPALQ
jgi:hypothetical protein